MFHPFQRSRIASLDTLTIDSTMGIQVQWIQIGRHRGSMSMKSARLLRSVSFSADRIELQPPIWAICPTSCCKRSLTDCRNHALRRGPTVRSATTCCGKQRNRDAPVGRQARRTRPPARAAMHQTGTRQKAQTAQAGSPVSTPPASRPDCVFDRCETKESGPDRRRRPDADGMNPDRSTRIDPCDYRPSLRE